MNRAVGRTYPIYSIDQVFADEQVKHLGMAQDAPNAEGRDLRLVAQPIKLSRTPSVVAARPPDVGEQTDETLASSALVRMRLLN
jgi:crotonobetainyl-CoA:carnitine CoA-transferase CaiB-like acyl-CoA transferase